MKFELEDTWDKGHSYRLYSLDVFPHKEWDQRSLYSGIPYLMGHSRKHDESIAYITPAETFVDIYSYESLNKRFYQQ